MGKGLRARIAAKFGSIVTSQPSTRPAPEVTQTDVRLLADALVIACKEMRVSSHPVADAERGSVLDVHAGGTTSPEDSWGALQKVQELVRRISAVEGRLDGHFTNGRPAELVRTKKLLLGDTWDEERVAQYEQLALAAALRST